MTAVGALVGRGGPGTVGPATVNEQGLALPSLGLSAGCGRSDVVGSQGISGAVCVVLSRHWVSEVASISITPVRLKKKNSTCQHLFQEKVPMNPCPAAHALILVNKPL